MSGFIYIPSDYSPFEHLSGRKHKVVKISDVSDVNSARFQTWRVAIEWYPSPVDISPKTAVIFTMGKDPAAAGTLAMALWHHWVQNPVGSGREFPKPSPQAEVVRIEEREYLRIWKHYHAAQKGVIRHMPTRDPKRPKAFWPKDEKSILL